MTTMLTLSILVAALYVVAATRVRYHAAAAAVPAASPAGPAAVSVPCGFAARITAALPDSLSALVYVLPQGRWRWLWSLWLAVVTLLTAPALMQATSASWWSSLLAAATVVCLAMTAAMPLLPGYHNRLHNALGIAAGVLSQVCVLFVCPWWLLAWLVYVLLLLIVAFPDVRWCNNIATAVDGKGVLIAEVICAATVYGSLLTRLAVTS